MRTLIAMLVLSIGCDEFDVGKYAPDPGTPPGEDRPSDTGEEGDTVLDCDEAPLVDWVNFGEGFFVQNCNGCHHSATPDRYGAPEDVIFDTADDVWAQKGMVLGTAGGESPTMPPNGGSTVTQREKLQIWLQCGDVGS